MGSTQVTWADAGEEMLLDLAAGRTGKARSYWDWGREFGAPRLGACDRLIGLDGLDVQPYEHQRRAVSRVVGELLGRAILADEVGLGKTIEAGLVLREMWLRGAVRSALILVPATLVWQWRDELTDTLQLPVREAAGAAEQWDPNGIVVASLDTAKRPAHRSKITEHRWDMVIVDEAHRLKNRSTLNWNFVNAIPKLNCLLLTATPIQNDLRELYNLVTLLKPGQLRTYASFKREFTWDKRSPKNVPKLKRLVGEVMVRTTRRESRIPAPPRRLNRLTVSLGREEADFYADLLRTVRELVSSLPKRKRNVLPLIVLLREACSSPQAAVRTLRAMRDGGRSEWGGASRADWAGLIERGERIGRPSKFAKVCELVANGREERYVVFTEYRATQEMLADGFEKIGVSVIRFHGEMNAGEKEGAVRAFKRDSDRRQVMVSTDAGAEGRNLQFCRAVINYDLPWNPMRIEQRIGRVHRIGQRRPVHVWNCVTSGTIEEELLNVLEEKVGLFRAVIGELDAILSELPDGFESSFARAVLEVPDDVEMRRRIVDLGESILSLWRDYEGVQRRNARLLDSRESASRRAPKEESDGHGRGDAESDGGDDASGLL